MTTRNLTRFLFPVPLLWLLLVAVPMPQTQAAGDMPTVAPRAKVAPKKVRKPKAAATPKSTVATPPPVAPVATTRYEEIELVPVPPPTPTPATEVAD